MKLAGIVARYEFAAEPDRETIRDKLEKARLRRRPPQEESDSDGECDRSGSAPYARSSPGHNRKPSDGNKTSDGSRANAVDSSNEEADSEGEDAEELLSRAEQLVKNRELWDSTLPEATESHQPGVDTTGYEYINQGASSKRTPEDFRTKPKKKFDLSNRFK